jgi:hypothetical protein
MREIPPEERILTTVSAIATVVPIPSTMEGIQDIDNRTFGKSKQVDTNVCMVKFELTEHHLNSQIFHFGLAWMRNLSSDAPQHVVFSLPLRLVALHIFRPTETVALPFPVQRGVCPALSSTWRRKCQLC